MTKPSKIILIFVFFATGCKSPVSDSVSKPRIPLLFEPAADTQAITLKTSPDNAASAYNVYYQKSTGGWETRKIQKSEETNSAYTFLTIDKLEDNTEYTFYITALNSAGESGASNRVTARTKLQTPVISKITAINHYTMALTWSAVPGAGSYSIFRGEKPDEIPSLPFRWDLPGDSNTCNVTVDPDTPYCFWVQAFAGSDAGGNNSKLSDPKEITSKLKSPESFAVDRIQVNHNSIVLRWDAVQGAVSYEIRYLPAAGSGAVPADPAVWSNHKETANTAYRIEGLTPNTTYHFAIKAINASLNESLFSSTEKAVTLFTPPNPAVTRQLNTTIALSWPEVSGAAMYQVSYNTDNSFDTARRQELSGTACTVRGLTAGTDYYFWVSAYSDRNSSRPSPALKSRTITSNIAIEFDFTNPADPVLLGMPDTIRQDVKDSYTVSVKTGDWDAGYAWYLNGALVSQEASYRVEWQLTAGPYVLTVIVTKDGVPYSASARFQVINN